MTRNLTKWITNSPLHLWGTHKEYITQYTQLVLIMLVLVITVCNIECMTAEHAQLMKVSGQGVVGGGRDVWIYAWRDIITQHYIIQPLSNYAGDTTGRKSGVV